MHTGDSIACSFRGQSFVFRCVRPADVGPTYVASLANERGYLETRDPRPTVASQRRYIADIEKSADRLLFGLFHRGELLATSGAQAVSSEEFSVGIFVFDGFRGRGLGKVLVWLSCTLLGRSLNVHRVRAGMKLDNLASLRSFLGCGFSVIGSDETYHRVSSRVCDLVKPPQLVLDADGSHVDEGAT